MRNEIKTVNVQLFKIKMTILFPSGIGKFKNGKNGTLIKGDQYVSRTCKLVDYQEVFQRTLQTVYLIKINIIERVNISLGRTVSGSTSCLSE